MSPKILPDGQYKICYLGTEWAECFFKGGSIEFDADDKEVTANCGVVKAYQKLKKVTFKVTFMSWNCDDIKLILPHLANPALSEGIVFTSSTCSQAETVGELVIELTCADGPCQYIVIPRANVEMDLGESIELGEDADQVSVSLLFTGYVSDAVSSIPGAFISLGAPAGMTSYDCATQTWS